MSIKFANNAKGFLSAGIGSTDTSIVLVSGDGARFPALVAGDFFYMTLEAATPAGDFPANEVVKVTARSGDSLTVVRGQDGTTAVAWAMGDRAELRVCRAAFERMNYDLPSTHKNLLDNSRFRVRQWATPSLGSSLASTAGTITSSSIADRWYIINSGITVGGSNYQAELLDYAALLQAISNGAPVSAGLVQRIPASRCAGMKGREMSVSIAASYGEFATHAATIDWEVRALRDTDTADQWANHTGFTNAILIASGQFSVVTAALDTYSASFTFDEANEELNKGVAVMFEVNLPADSLAANTNAMRLSRAQLECSPVPTDYEPIPFDVELARCKVFYEHSYEYGVDPSTVTNSGCETWRMSIADTAAFFNRRYVASKHRVPGVTWFNPTTGASASLRNATSSTNITVTGVHSLGPATEEKLPAPSFTSTGAAGTLVLAHWTADAELY